jgi:hypothetical protein
MCVAALVLEYTLAAFGAGRGGVLPMPWYDPGTSQLGVGARKSSFSLRLGAAVEPKSEELDMTEAFDI